jgi:hypothetical protein
MNELGLLHDPPRKYASTAKHFLWAWAFDRVGRHPIKRGAELTKEQLHEDRPEVAYVTKNNSYTMRFFYAILTPFVKWSMSTKL